MLNLTCTMIFSVDLARYGVSRAKDLGIWGLWYKSNDSFTIIMNNDCFVKQTTLSCMDMKSFYIF